MFDKPFRLHFSSIIEQVLRTCWIIIVLILTNFIGAINELKAGQINFFTAMISVGVLCGILLVIFIIAFFRWRKTYITLNKDTLIIEKKLIMKNITTLGLKNIATVDLEQNILSRIFGTAKIKIDTNSLSTANETDVKIILKKEKAELFRKEILKYLDKNQGITEAKTDDREKIEEEKIEEEKYDVEYDFDRVLEHTLLSVPIFSIIYVLGMLGFSIYALGGDGIAKNHSGDVFGLVIALGILIIPVIYGTINIMFKLYNFKAKRVANKIQISYGLFTKKRYTIPIEKINAVIIKQPTLARIAKRYTVELVNVGLGEEQQESPVMVLMCEKEELQEKLQVLLPELKVDFKAIKQPTKVIVPISLKVGIPTIIAGIISILTMPIFLVAIIPFAILVGILMYITKRINIREKDIVVVNGIFARKTVIIKYEKIQKIDLKNSILTQKLGIKKSSINILASLQNIEHTTGYFEDEVFEKILKSYN